jgi:hypothetical protein
MVWIVLGWILGVVVGVLLLYGVAKEFGKIAEMKGHNGRTYFWWTFWLGFVGMLMVVALPYIQTNDDSTKRNIPLVAQNEPDEKIVVPAKASSVESVDAENLPVNDSVRVGTKACPKCGQIQMANKTKCWGCGSSI